ncbi:hypothetical protein [Burkholderia gladioli]|uniref:hypothetical protein n=1 Tax=Burkholderia gladioli TaxID=28095 RepID=UPI000D00E5DF|nr:hypothetical protein [Burkholderia gladioli]MDN7805426.1 hypothetical protein [Burkholderia gladioli]PRH01607.1 hypothetical protein C6V08_14335 [Burkholderia gladioli]PRH32970.1 hypothetical protein C6V07_24370 [Burkholderia gladioli]
MKANKVTEAVTRASQNLIPSAEELAWHAEQDKQPHATILLSIACVLADEAAENFAPLAGQPIDGDAREKLARAFAVAMHDHLPPLANLKRA